ncbi:MAG TPA: hypothetical protein VHZ07_23675 [Bryobacteraceae bacterium]|jgi:hypothetical protein|nr:hypothetical protein [Bryobacteraceae bacterium]
MKARYWSVAVVSALLVGSAASSYGAAGTNCDRACLTGFAEKYLSAMVTHDPHNAPFATNVKFTEDGAPLELPDGLWRTASGLGPYRLYVVDPDTGQIAFFATGLENGAPVILAARLKVVHQKITEAETEVTRITPPVGGSKTGLDALPDALKDKPRPQFLQDVPPSKRLTHEQLIDDANAYWDDLESNDGSKPNPFAADCQRLEGGHPTTNLPAKPGAPPSGANMSCAAAFGLGFYREDNRVRDRRYLVVDRERNLVYQVVFIDHDGTVRQFKLTDGREIIVKRTAPYTWLASAVIQITPEGKISQIEATPNAVPYGMPGNWSNGETRPTHAKWNRKMED